MPGPETTRESIVVVSGADAAYACPLAVMLRSVADQLSPPRRLEAHVIDGGLGDALRDRVQASLLRAPVTVHWHPSDPRRFRALPVWGRMTTATYLKLLAPELLPSSMAKALWLDADVVALADVAGLWNGEHGDAPARAAPDPLVRTVGARFGVAGWKALGLDPSAPYFNAGVLVMNLTAWRADDVGGRALDYVRRHWERVYFLDQEGLNAVLAGRWAPLDPSWNWSPSMGASGVEPRLVHFTGNLKPWRRHGRTRWHQLYYVALDRTAWRGSQAETSPTRWSGWYETSSLRRVLRPMENWYMTLTRWRTLRLAAVSDVEGEPDPHGLHPLGDP